MTRKVAISIILIGLLVGFIVVPAQADIAGSALSAVSPAPVVYGTTFDITFTVNFISPGGVHTGEYMDYMDVTVPDQWTINAVYNTPHTIPDGFEGCTSTSEGTLGQTIYWASACTGDLAGAWPPGTVDFVANVTVTSCEGAPWSLPWNISGDEWRYIPPHDVSGNYLIGCSVPGPDPEPVVVPGCDALLPIPATAVGGTFVADAPVYWAPGKLANPLVTIAAGNSARVIGLDASGEYYQIIWGCNFLWVPKATLGPNYDAVWHGAPLPTGVIEVPVAGARDGGG